MIRHTSAATRTKNIPPQCNRSGEGGTDRAVQRSARLCELRFEVRRSRFSNAKNDHMNSFSIFENVHMKGIRRNSERFLLYVSGCRRAER